MCTSTKVKNATINLTVTADEVNHSEFTTWCEDANFKVSKASVAVNSAYQSYLNLIGQSSKTKLNGLSFLGITHLDIEEVLLTNLDQISIISNIWNAIGNKLTVWITSFTRNEKDNYNGFCSSFI